ncbi:MAG TPA: FAD-binding domain [Vicinamibacterales bacterium]|nr:FAD-binding domain [Vicinamibacterales bacterium]
MRIAINGVGVAGPTLAYWLRRAGHEPVLFEKAPSLRTAGYVIDFWGPGFEIAARMGLAAAVRERGYAMERLRIVDGRGRPVAQLSVAPLRRRLQDRFVTIPRGDLAELLYQACDDVPAHFGTSIVGVEQNDGGVTVQLSDGSVRAFDAVIGADGLHSAVRAAVFGPESRFEHSLDCDVAVYRIDGYRPREELAYVSYTVPGRQAARISLRGDRTLVLLLCDARLIGDHPTTAQDQHAALRRAFGGMQWEVPALLDGLTTTRDFYFDRVSQIRMPQWSIGRVALAGDAAACVSLLAGEGTGLAMVEAYVLAHEFSQTTDPARAFAAYESRLRPLIERKQQAALRMRGFFVPKTSFGLAVRNWLVAVASWPLLTGLILGPAISDDVELPDFAAG